MTSTTNRITLVDENGNYGIVHGVLRAEQTHHIDGVPDGVVMQVWSEGRDDDVQFARDHKIESVEDELAIEDSRLPDEYRQLLEPDNSLTQNNEVQL